MHMHEPEAHSTTLKWNASCPVAFDRSVGLHVQANAVLQEVESSTPGNKTQIVFERQADISPEALAELIEKARPAALSASACAIFHSIASVFIQALPH